MKLKDLLSEGRFDMEHPDELEPSEEESEGNSEACSGCGRMPGDGYGDDCDDPAGCGYWKEWAREAVADWKRDRKHQGDLEEGSNFFDKYMEETLWLEDRRARQLKAPVVAEGFGKIRQKRVQELPGNRIKFNG